MGDIRKIAQILSVKPTIEGAGVHLKRAFGYNEAPQLDPFLLLDHFGSENPDDYLAGFPWHPHRGIETVTYMLSGEVEHGDSIGNKGVIGAGDVQWMTAGSGIVHQEMPQRSGGLLMGFQLWVNLPAAKKMTEPRYMEIKKSQVPEVELRENVTARVTSGRAAGVQGPVTDLFVDTIYLDVTVGPGAEFEYEPAQAYKTFAYVIEGSGYFDPERSQSVTREHLVIYQKGRSVRIAAGSEILHFLFIAGEPIDEPIAWRGPIVMNTEEEIKSAFEEYRNGTFIKSRR
jgi:redox-sensitive bicupin YhaK (pirin superfamily)